MMFFKKQKQEVVSCDKCKCFLSKSDAQCVDVLDISSLPGSFSMFFCREHKKPYCKMIHYKGECCYFEQLRVNKKGEPIGFKKITNKK